MNILSYLKLLPILISLSAAAYGVHWYIVKQKDDMIEQLQANVVQLSENNATLKTAVENNEQTVKSLEEELERQTDRVLALTRINNEIQKEKDQYLSIFRKHDLFMLSKAKPGLIEIRINQGTESIFEELERVSREENVEN